MAMILDQAPGGDNGRPHSGFYTVTHPPADRRGRWSFRISALVSELSLLMTAGYPRHPTRHPLNIGAALAAVACLALAACSIPENLPPMPPYVPPSMPTPEAVGKAVKQVVTDAHLIGPIEMSDLRPNEHGVGYFKLCIRGVSNDSRTGTYVLFFDNNDYKGQRLPAILDGCEKQSYRPFVPPVERPEKSVGPKPSAR
jgi:hypothetical protein